MEVSDESDSALLNQNVKHCGLAALGPCRCTFHNGLGAILDGLKDHAIPVGEFEQLIELVLQGVGVNAEP